MIGASGIALVLWVIFLGLVAVQFAPVLVDYIRQWWNSR